MQKTIRLDTIEEIQELTTIAKKIDEYDTYDYATNELNKIANNEIEAIIAEIEEDRKWNYIQELTIWTDTQIWRLGHNGHVHYFDIIERHPPKHQ